MSMCVRLHFVVFSWLRLPTLRLLQRVVILGLLSGIASLQESHAEESLYFGLVDQTGQLNLDAAEKLFDRDFRVSRIVTLGGRYFPYDGQTTFEVLDRATDLVGKELRAPVTFQAMDVTETGTVYYRYECDDIESQTCSFDRRNVYSVPRDIYQDFFGAGRLIWETWESTTNMFVSGYSPENGQMGLRFTIWFYENGEPYRLSINEVYPVRSEIMQILRRVFIQDLSPDTRPQLVYEYFFQPGIGRFH